MDGDTLKSEKKKQSIRILKSDPNVHESELSQPEVVEIDDAEDLNSSYGNFFKKIF